MTPSPIRPRAVHVMAVAGSRRDERHIFIAEFTRFVPCILKNSPLVRQRNRPGPPQWSKNPRVRSKRPSKGPSVTAVAGRRGGTGASRPGISPFRALHQHISPPRLKILEGHAPKHCSVPKFSPKGEKYINLTFFFFFFLCGEEKFYGA